MEPITIAATWLFTTLSSSLVGKWGNHYFDKGADHLSKRIKDKIGEPTNHHIQKAIRKSYLQAMLLAAENAYPAKDLLSSIFEKKRDNIAKIKASLKKEIEKTGKDLPLARNSSIDAQHREMLFPKEGTGASEMLPGLIEKLKDGITAEFAEIGLPLPDRLRTCIYSGWEEKGKAIDFYQLTCAFFTQELKDNDKLAAYIQTEYLDGIAAALGDITGKVTDLHSLMSVYYEQYKDLLPKVGEILASLEEIKEDVRQTKDDVREIKNLVQMLSATITQETVREVILAIQDNSITSGQLVVSDKYQSLIHTIEGLKADIQKTVSQIKGVEGAIAQVDDPTKALLHENRTSLENQLWDHNRELEDKENELNSFVSDLLNLAKRLQETKGLDSERLERVRELFAQGKYNELLTVLDERQIDRDIAEYEERGRALASELTIKAQAVLLNKEYGWYDEADRLFTKALGINEYFDTLFAYAYFLSEHNQVNNATELYERSLKHCSDDEDKADVLNNLGILYNARKELEKAEASHSEALEITRKLAEINQQSFLPILAASLDNLGNVHAVKNEFEKAETSYNESLKIRRKQAESNPEAFLPDVAMSLNNLGVLYWDTNEFEKAEVFYHEALEIRRKSAEYNPQVFLPQVAMTLNNLGILYNAINDLEKAETCYHEALEIRRKFAENNPQVFLPNVATTLHNLGILYNAIKDLEKAETCYNEALRIRRKLAGANPQVFLPSVGSTLNNLGILQTVIKDFVKAEISYQEALEIRRKLIESNPQAFLPHMAMTLHNLGVLYNTIYDLEKAEISFYESLEIKRKLIESNPQAFLPDLAIGLYNLGLLQIKINEIEKAKISFYECLEIRRALAQASPAAYGIVLSETIICLASFYQRIRINKKKSIAFAQEALISTSAFIRTVPFAASLATEAQKILDDWENKE